MLIVDFVATVSSGGHRRLSCSSWMYTPGELVLAMEPRDDQETLGGIERTTCSLYQVNDVLGCASCLTGSNPSDL